MRRILLLGLGLLLLLALCSSAPVQGAGDAPPVSIPLVCFEVPFSPPGPVITLLRYNTGDECVTITNQSRKEVSLAGYRLKSDPDQWYDFPAIGLPPQTEVRIHSGPEALDAPSGDLLWSYRHMWNDNGDAARLYDPTGALVDVWVY